VIEERLRNTLSNSLPESLAKLENPLSPQYRSLRWLRSNPPTSSELNFRPVIETYVLLVLYYSTNGGGWLDNTGWLSNGDRCKWFSTSSTGTICDDLGQIIEIDLRSNNLKGSLPSELILLKDSMKRIRVNGNSLEGTLPSFIGEMTNLERFHAHWNSFSGTIPTDLGKLGRLKSLRLGQNGLVGNIPLQLARIGNLQALDLGSNSLNGIVPYFLGDLTDLTELDLSNNNFSGTIPPQFSKLSSLIGLELDRNNLTGSMPTEICSPIFRGLEVAKVDCQEVYCWCCEGCSYK